MMEKENQSKIFRLSFFHKMLLAGFLASILLAVGIYVYSAADKGKPAPQVKRLLPLTPKISTSTITQVIQELNISTATKKQAGKQAPAAPVVASAARTGDIPIYVFGLGTVTPLNTVTVKSRVDGQLMKVLFKEGQVVKKDQLIAQIDERPFQAQLTEAWGQLVKDKALLSNSQLDLRRYESLAAHDAIPRQQLDTQAALVEQYEGQVKVDQGAVENARLQVVYSRITAPITGLIGLRAVDPGNIVHATDVNGMAVITQLQPITVLFSIPENNLPEILAKFRSKTSLTVDAFDRDNNKKISTGSLIAIDNQIDLNSGTVRMRAMFTNRKNELFPNQFVNARLRFDTKKSATIIPTAAIQQGPHGNFVYIVKADHTVTVRPVTSGVGVDDIVSIDNGLAPGEVVVIEGADRLREGSRVEVELQGGEAQASSSVARGK